MLTKDVQTYLETVSGVTALVSTRLYPHHIPKGNTTFPVVTHQLISTSHSYVLGSAAGMATATVQIDCWGKTLSDVETLAEAIRQALQGYSGAMGSTSVAFVTLDNENDLHETPKDGGKVYIYRRSMDFGVKYAESVPT